MKCTLIIFSLFVISAMFSETSAQHKSSKLKPQWITKSVPTETLCHFFEGTYGESSTLDGARQRCLINLSTKLEYERGLVINSRFSGKTKMTRDDYTMNEEFEMECIENGKEINIVCRTIDEYWEKSQNGLYQCHLLYAIENSSNPSYAQDHIRVTSAYGARGLWRSMIVPGWGQMHKGSYVKGGIMLGGTVVLAGGIIFTESMRKSCYAQIGQTHSSTAIKQLSANAANWAIGRNICIGTAAALYVYNLVDAIVAPGARRVVVTPGYMAVRF